MAKNIEPSLKHISGFLKLGKSERFVIPEYQRAYSWDVSQCDKLWQDIEAFISSNATDPYFFGTIIVDCSQTDRYHLIDGQQRTTTFLLLLKALLIRLNEVLKTSPADEDSEALIAGLKANRNKVMSILYKAEDEEIPAMLKDESKTSGIQIIENRSINELYREETGKIIGSPDLVSAEARVERIPRKQKDNKYTSHFRNYKFLYNKLKELGDIDLNRFGKTFLEKCQVIEIRSWQVEQAITMFNSLNSTGMPLSDADIISAKLYSNSGNGSKEFMEQWARINHAVNELSIHKVVDLDDVLRQYMYLKRAARREYIGLMVDGKETVDLTTPGLRRYYTEINSTLLKDPIQLCGDLLKITDLWNVAKDHASVKLLLRFNENAKLFLMSYLFRFNAEEVNETRSTGICDCLLRLFTVLELVDSGYSSSRFKTFLFGMNIKLVDRNIPLDTIRNDFDDHIRKNWSDVELEGTIAGYDGSLLVYLNEFLFARDTGKRFGFPEDPNIEHIMPSSGRNITSIRHDAGLSDVDEFNSVVNKLGNKILLEDDINRSIGNEWFKTKKQSSIRNKAGYKDSRFPIALSLVDYPTDTWTKEDIGTATGKAAARIVKFIFNQ